MTLVRAMSASLLVLVAAGCGSAPPDPPLAAATITVLSNGSGSQCVPATSLMEIPGGLSQGAVNTALTCPLSQSDCDPTTYLAEDGKNHVSVSCSVKEASGNFNVQLSVDAPGNFSFNLQGTLSQTTGTNVHVGTVNYGKSIAASDDKCTVTVRQISAGQVLATYACPTFDVAGGANAPGCQANGAFLFDRCSK